MRINMVRNVIRHSSRQFLEFQWIISIKLLKYPDKISRDISHRTLYALFSDSSIELEFRINFEFEFEFLQNLHNVELELFEAIS
jgi:hypothetical protein